MKLPYYNSQGAQTFALSVCIGAVIQIAASQYIKSHPEFFGKENEEIDVEIPKDIIEKKTIKRLFKKKIINSVKKNTNRKLRKLLIRGGAVVTIATVFGIIKFLSETGTTIVVLGDIVSKLLHMMPKNQISTYLRESLVQNMSHLEKTWFDVDIDQLKEIKVTDLCDKDLTYLFNIVKDPTLPFEERERLSLSIFTRYFDLKPTESARCISFLTCISLILFLV